MSREAFSIMPQEFEETVYEMAVVAPDGLGYGDGTISTRNRENGPLTGEQLSQAMEIITTHKNQVIVPVEEMDDGCGDGRPAGMVFQAISPSGERTFYRKSKLRAKIFGGGVQVAASMWRSVAGEPNGGETVLGDRKFIAGKLKSRGIDYGAHTDSHANGDSCGCGAIDKYTLSTEKSAKFHDDITGNTRALAGDALADGEELEKAFQVRAAISGDTQYMSDASGATTMAFIEGDGAVIKQLEHDHLEAITIVNDEPGTTVDQRAVIELFEAAQLPTDIQIFVIDVWRGKMYAEVVADIATAELGADYETARQIAIGDFYINQLSVAATLTDGSQPVIHNKAA